MADGALSAASATWTGRACPKCGYVRRPSDTNPDWQCPRCLVAYAKVDGSARAAPRFVAGPREIAADSASDHSAYTLVAANLFAIAVAHHSGMTLRDMMLVYWAQSVVIGLSFFIRILALRNFSVEKPLDESLPWYRGMGNASDRQGTPEDYVAGVNPDSAWSRSTFALFFLFHYGFFHVVYLVFLIAPHGEATRVAPLSLGLCALGFAIHHAFSLAHNIRSDREGRPNLHTLVGVPYFRIIPMHATIVVGGLMFGGTGFMLLFGALKTFADVVMHSIEHRMLRGHTPPPWARL